MAFLLVGDEFYDSLQVIEAGNAAIGLWTRAGSWSNKHAAAGCFPLSALALCGTTGQAKRLVEAGLWLPEDGGWRDALYRARPGRADAEHVRRVRAEAGRAGGRASARSRAQTTRPTAREQAVATYESWKNGTGPAELEAAERPEGEGER